MILACTAGETDVPGRALVDAIERRPDRRASVVLWLSHSATADIGAARAVVDAGAHLLVGGGGWTSTKLPRRVRRVATLQAAIEQLA